MAQDLQGFQGAALDLLGGGGLQHPQTPAIRGNVIGSLHCVSGTKSLLTSNTGEGHNFYADVKVGAQFFNLKNILEFATLPWILVISDRSLIIEPLSLPKRELA